MEVVVDAAQKEEKKKMPSAEEERMYDEWRMPKFGGDNPDKYDRALNRALGRPSNKETLAKRRKERMSQMQQELHKCGVHLFIDRNQSGKLEKDEIKIVLTEVDFTTPRGTPPTAEEIDFILKIGDRNGDGCIDKAELKNALICWKRYIQDRVDMETTLKKYDTSGSGKLEKEELKAYLTDLNDGIEPLDSEVDWVMSEADGMRGGKEDGALETQELIMATQSWYWMEVKKDEQVKSSACCSIS